MLAVVGAQFDMAIMMRVGRSDIHKVQSRVLQHFLVAAKGFLYPVGGGKALSAGEFPGCHRIQFHFRMSVLVEQTDGVCHNAGDLPGAKNAHFHGRVLLFCGGESSLRTSIPRRPFSRQPPGLDALRLPIYNGPVPDSVPCKKRRDQP